MKPRARQPSPAPRGRLAPHARAGLAGTLLGAIVAAQPVVAEVPEPLGLVQAIEFAEAHPRVQAAPDAVLPPRPQPLFLGCHTLAFGDARAADQHRDVGWSALLPPATAQQLEIVQRYFDVLLADLSFMRDDEAMAVGYIQYDRADNRRELGQVSPLRVAELEAAYQIIRRQRAASDASRRLTRSLLAQAIGQPTDLPKTLIEPPPPALPDPLPTLDAIVAAALADNPRLGELLAAGDDAADAVLAMAVRQQALELLLRLELLGVAAQQTKIEADWRDLKLDQSRTMYEMEVAADLGYSMSQQTKARRDESAVALCTALTLAELNALQGKPLIGVGAGAGAARNDTTEPSLEDTD